MLALQLVAISSCAFVTGLMYGSHADKKYPVVFAMNIAFNILNIINVLRDDK